MPEAQKPITFNGATGGFDEVSPKTVSAGAADAGKLFVPGADGKWDESLLPTVDGARAIQAGETLSAGDFVNVHDDGGTPTLRRADASSIATRAHGFVKTAASEGATVKFYESGPAAGFSGLGVGATYFLSDAAPGEVAPAAPTATGHIAQVVGVAVSATELQVDISEQPVVRSVPDGHDRGA
jgi:hypothetical protein